MRPETQDPGVDADCCNGTACAVSDRQLEDEIMTDNQDSKSKSKPTARERELEVEVARLQAELDTLRGEDPSVTTSRFLAMAAATVDAAVADARREADEIIEEISSEAEARRDEATRVAAEAEALAEEMLTEADNAQDKVNDARREAERVTAAAQEEAATIVTAGRESIAVEAEAFAEVRSALEEERKTLETYHDGLRQRVQELATTMVSFMNTELPADAAASLENIAAPQLAAVVQDDESTDFNLDTEAEISEEEPGPSQTADVVDDPWIEMLEAAIPEEDRIVDMPETAIDEIPAGPPSTFGGAPVVEDDADNDSADKPVSAGLFSRARGDEETVIGFEDLAGEDEDDEVGLFSAVGSRLVEQTRADELAEALETEDSEDQAFRQFLDGDDAPDPSRDWLLRPDQG